MAALPKNQDGDTVLIYFCGKVNYIRCLRLSFEAMYQLEALSGIARLFSEPQREIGRKFTLFA